MNKNPNDGNLRKQFYDTKKKYKSILKMKKLEFERKKIEEMELAAYKGRDFWKDFKRIRNTGEENESLPEPIKVQTFFENLYKENEDGTKVPVKEKQYITIGNLSERITMEEIKKHLKILKRRKACGKDGILNEMLIFANDKLIKIFHTIFNYILDKEKYPEMWNYSLTQLIFKEGDRDDPGNYRGIALTSNLSKLFNAIMNSRIYAFLEERGIIKPEQGGFTKKFRTQDHIFTIQSIVKKYLTKNKKVYACYVDLKKAYDSVWREGLLHKLRKNGIDKKTVNIIDSMYKNTYTSIIYKNYLLDKIRVTKGLKQGDNLSPLLFNIYINDLPEKLAEGKSAPVDVNGSKINCLMWADDIILLSESPEGLQNSLDNLNRYCTDWKLEINKKKTKVMIFNKSGRKLKKQKFFLGKYLLQNVTQYKYLGFIISASGTYSHGIKNLVDRAKRAWFSIYSILAKSKNKPINTYITLFEYVVKPVLLYGCEIWGETIKNDRDICDLGGEDWERFHLRVCKNILGVHKNTTNIAVLSELGRYPMSHDIHKQMVKYLLRFEDMAENRLAKIAFEEQKRNSTKNTHWVSKVKCFLDKMGLSFIHNTHKARKNPGQINHMSVISRNRENEIFEQNLIQKIDEKIAENRGKLLFFGGLKRHFGREDYLHMYNENLRKQITQLRLSSHKLEIEMGRHNDIEREERICNYCRMGRIESEEHFLFECPNYAKEREHFRAQLLSHNKTFGNEMGGRKLLNKIFRSKDNTVFTLLGNFISNSWKTRHLMGSNLQNMGPKEAITT